MPSKDAHRKLICRHLDKIAGGINQALKGKQLKKMAPVLSRIARGQQLPHWYKELKSKGTLPNLDGKTIGSIVEMLLVGVLETTDFEGKKIPKQRINPARGVDLPDLDLGIKSPSENYCTSEPFFSAYERLLGSEYDIVVLLTDYQTAKKSPPLKLQIIKWQFLKKTQVADRRLCKLALENRDWLLAENEAWAKKLFRFLAYVNQSDWRARHLLKFIPGMRDLEKSRKRITAIEADFISKNKEFAKKDKKQIPDEELEAILRIQKTSPAHLGVIDALDTWVLDTLKEVGRAPNENEWSRLKSGPLDGMIGMSFALQWRYNFGRLF